MPVCRQKDSCMKVDRNIALFICMDIDLRLDLDLRADDLDLRADDLENAVDRFEEFDTATRHGNVSMAD